MVVWKRGIGGVQCREDSRKRVGDIAIEWVVELGVAANGKEIGVESQFDAPFSRLWRLRRVFRDSLDGGRRIVGCELRRYRGCQLRRKSATEGDGPLMDAESRILSAAAWCWPGELSPRLLHVLRPTVVVGRDRESDLHEIKHNRLARDTGKHRHLPRCSVILTAQGARRGITGW